MEILYKSTRSDAEPITASQAILAGLAPDGGLYVPTEDPSFDRPLKELVQLSYKELAYAVMKQYLTDFTEEELRACIEGAYDEKFDTPAVAPLVKKGNAWYLELFHGATIAFKDMALSILPYLMTAAAKKNNSEEEIVILTATSGDTGKAAMAGFADVPGTRIIVFYPKGGVSMIQELQMLTQKGANTAVAKIHGNFDDAQSAVKKVFNDAAMKEELARHGFRFSSANSINIGRLVPQIVYYVHAYCSMVRSGDLVCGDPINICVPTGNFGNILAAYYAKQMGLPVRTLICASNENKVLTDFFRTGDYDKKRPFILTSSPSMDILISSNLERLIYRICGNDPSANKELMDALSAGGEYVISGEMKQKLDDFYGGCASEEENFKGIAELYRETGYVIDTHTGIGAAVYRKYLEETADGTPTVIASTASPYKFAASVVHAIDPAFSAENDFGYIDRLRELSGVPEPNAITEIRSAKILHDRETTAETLPDTIREILGIE
ncbi:MAG: threonine synthase [Lachnospiraceae bacterium]|nr:threonine synthase [Lachnospiraceae bacterium]